MAKQTQKDTPNRIVRAARIEVAAAPDEAFPLLTPAGEGLWSEDWSPVHHYPEGGVPEEGAVFTTAEGPRGGRVWTILDYTPTQHRIAYLSLAPGYLHIWISIDCRATGEGNTEADITYIYTALSDAGRAYLAKMNEAAFREQVRHWEHAINHYLRSGGTRT
jgi:hypothetical protein